MIAGLIDSCDSIVILQLSLTATVDALHRWFSGQSWSCIQREIPKRIVGDDTGVNVYIEK